MLQPRILLQGLLSLWSAGLCLAQNYSTFPLQTVIDYAPRIILAPGEIFLPSSIDYALANEQVQNADGSLVTGVNSAAQPNPLTSYNLNFQKSTAVQSMEYLTSNSTIGCSTCYDPPYLRGQNPATTSVPTYAVIRPRGNGVVSVYYWLFYPFNGGKQIGACANVTADGIGITFNGSDVAVLSTLSLPSTNATQAEATSVMAPGPCQLNIGELGNHVGDWERIQVRFNYNETGGTPVPTQVTLSQHSTVARYNWGDRNLTLLNGTHTVAYAANGSHGNYNVAANNQYSQTDILGTTVALLDKTGNGTVWDTFNNVAISQWQQNLTYYSGNSSWLGYTGTWGNAPQGCDALAYTLTKECELSPGLVGPQQQMWRICLLAPDKPQQDRSAKSEKSGVFRHGFLEAGCRLRMASDAQADTDNRLLGRPESCVDCEPISSLSKPQFARAVEENATLQRALEGAMRQYTLMNQQLQLMKQHAIVQDIEQMSLMQSIASMHHPMVHASPVQASLDSATGTSRSLMTLSRNEPNICADSPDQRLELPTSAFLAQDSHPEAPRTPNPSS
ncbi:hypothetical protein WJX74_005581 [Apatococcus lobatus]|uniref:DUF1554 domain-containing protein n=1 Tax=Apatococcus lobatus TaxID=904363 RepID=A0AAW1QMU3_9CHLO